MATSTFDDFGFLSPFFLFSVDIQRGWLVKRESDEWGLLLLLLLIRISWALLSIPDELLLSMPER